ncbi:acylglycerol lipase [Sarracenia purpurea var. burkii]
MADDAVEVLLTSGASGRVNALFSLRVLKSLLIMTNAFFMLLLLPFRGRKRSASASSMPKLSSSSLSLSLSCDKTKDEKQDGGGSHTQRKGPVVRVPASVPWKSSAAAVAAVDQEVAARRALAIRRVVQGKEEKSVREFSLLVTYRDETMFTQSWTPVSKEIRSANQGLPNSSNFIDESDFFACYPALPPNKFSSSGPDYTWMFQGSNGPTLILLGAGETILKVSLAH